MLKKSILTSVSLIIGLVSSSVYANEINPQLKSNPDIYHAIDISQRGSHLRAIDMEHEPNYGASIYKGEMTEPSGQVTTVWVDVKKDSILSSQPEFTTAKAAKLNSQWYQAQMMGWIINLTDAIKKAEKMTNCDAQRGDYDGNSFYEIDLKCPTGKEIEIFIFVKKDGNILSSNEHE